MDQPDPSVTVLAHSHPVSLPPDGSSPPWFVVPGGQVTHRPFETCSFVPHGGALGVAATVGGAQITFWRDHAPSLRLHWLFFMVPPSHARDAQ